MSCHLVKTVLFPIFQRMTRTLRSGKRCEGSESESDEEKNPAKKRKTCPSTSTSTSQEKQKQKAKKPPKSQEEKAKNADYMIWYRGHKKKTDPGYLVTEQERNKVS